jgi:hypothetical protein
VLSGVRRLLFQRASREKALPMRIAALRPAAIAAAFAFIWIAAPSEGASPRRETLTVNFGPVELRPAPICFGYASAFFEAYEAGTGDFIGIGELCVVELCIEAARIDCEELGTWDEFFSEESTIWIGADSLRSRFKVYRNLAPQDGNADANERLVGVITGGTGRYEGATGSLHGGGTVEVPDPMDWPQIFHPNVTVTMNIEFAR